MRIVEQLLAACVACTPFAVWAADEVVPDYNRDVAPVLRKYCVGCHNNEDRDAKLSLESFAEIQRGGESGAVVLAGDAKSSRLLRVLTGQAQPQMPPADEPAPKAGEIDVLRAWVAAGAPGPQGAEYDRTVLLTPKIQPAKGLPQAVTALDWSPTANLLAVARFRRLELIDAQTAKQQFATDELPGKANSVAFSADGERVVVASGVAGLFGEAIVVSVKTKAIITRLKGHRDILYAARISPDGKFVATGGYDKNIILWNMESGEPVREFSGHNGAILDLAFSPDGRVLASASADETVKLWQVATGLRLDTLGQPLEPQFTVTFSPDGKFVVAGGADNRIRVWRFVSRDKPQINPLVFARFAHEGPVLRLVYSHDGRRLVTLGEDGLVKLWETKGYTQVFAYPQQTESTVALAAAPRTAQFYLGRMDGSIEKVALKQVEPVARVATSLQSTQIETAAARHEYSEQEPNNAAGNANPIELPAFVRGTISGGARRQAHDVDAFRFDAKAGQVWQIEINAARMQSPLDSRVEVLDADGRPIVRTVLQAVRDSYFTFRGKDSNTIDDFRLHNWQEMDLNQYLYASGEVVRLWLYPRGPDSGFQVYPGRGKRYTYFDTSPISHALQEPCYIVEPHSPGEQLIPNGLPTFLVYYENDDDALRRSGADSRLTFTTPADGSYVVRVSDVRGFHGDTYKYELTVRPSQPDFKVTLSGENPKVNAGGGKEFQITAERIDGYDGPIQVDIDGLPPGFHVTTPLVIEAGQEVARGTISADADAPQPTEENASGSQVRASARIGSKVVRHDVKSLGKIQLADRSKVVAKLLPATGDLQPGKPLEFTIAPGETITARVRIERHGFDGRVSFGTADAGRNLPHGVYVDNIGLNGLMIVEGQNERLFFITAAGFVQETSRTFHLMARVEGNQTTLPVTLHVRHKPRVAAAN